MRTAPAARNPYSPERDIFGSIAPLGSTATGEASAPSTLNSPSCSSRPHGAISFPMRYVYPGPIRRVSRRSAGSQSALSLSENWRV